MPPSVFDELEMVERAVLENAHAAEGCLDPMRALGCGTVKSKNAYLFQQHAVAANMIKYHEVIIQWQMACAYVKWRND